MGGYVLDIREIGRDQVAVAGGKGANLGELSRLEGVNVPAGFCVTTHAFRRALAQAPALGDRLTRLARLAPEDREAIGAGSAEIRRTIEAIAIPADLVAAIEGSLARFGEHAAYAVRSSATAEDLPTASFAGQGDSFLNVVGRAAILEHVRRCWASLFSERAVTYRARNGGEHRGTEMAVVVQRMVLPRAAGVLFTADPVTSNRKVACVEAGLGVAEELVSGRRSADVYRVRGEEVVTRGIAAERPALTDADAVRLVRLGRRIEGHFDHPQDIEWCLADGEFQIVQSRPITTLFPIPPAADGESHVYVSVGHQQMMTDAMKPLGLSVWQLTTPRPMAEAGGRLFVDVARELASPGSRERIVEALGKSDPLIGDALRTVVERDGFIPALAEEPEGNPAIRPQGPIEIDPSVVTDLIDRSEASVLALRRAIRAESGPALVDFILADILELKRILFDPRSLQVIKAGTEATWWLNERLQAWLGEKNAADALTQSVPHNVTAEMGLALLDVADAIRPHPEVVAFLRQAEDDGFLDELPALPGGPQARAAIQGFLDRYGMRCAGEIDITRPRWSERPATLLPMILGNVQNFEAGAGRRLFEQGREEAAARELEILGRLRELPDGARKAEEAKWMIDRVRAFAGYREYPKYGMVSRYFVYKQALLEEAERLVRAGVLAEAEDVFYLTLEELREAMRSGGAEDRLVRRRRDEYASYRALTPPRVLTSDGEIVAGAYRREDVPAGALAGLPVSAGTVEGRARVVLDVAAADLEPGDILVTAYTDPSWTPLFVAIEGLVTEVGGLMTHGAVIAREYGLPAVVGVERASELIEDGQRIRLHGTDGYVEILDASLPAS